MSGQSYQVGDVFKFKIDNARHVYGQIVAIPPHDLMYIAVFDLATSQEQDLATIVSRKILILAQSMDAKLDSREWQLVGNTPVNEEDFVFPEYKMHTPSGWVVVNHEGHIVRLATHDDLRKLKLKKSFSPAAIQYAVRAHFGLVEYKEFCNELIAEQ